MAMQAFNVGLDAFYEWETADYEWLALTAGTFDADIDTVADLLAGDAVESTALARIPVTTRDRTVDDTTNLINYSADDPSWSAPGAGDTITAVVLTKVITDDTDSLPIAWWTVSPTASDATDPLVFTLPSGVVAYTTQAA